MVTEIRSVVALEQGLTGKGIRELSGVMQMFSLLTSYGYEHTLVLACTVLPVLLLTLPRTILCGKSLSCSQGLCS